MPAKKRSLLYSVRESRCLYDGFISKLVKDRFYLRGYPGKLFTRETLVHPGAVAILPWVDKKHIILLRQFRYAAKTFLWEIPAGTLEKGEHPLSCAKRELEEETGFSAKTFRKLSTFYPAPGVSSEIMHLFSANGLLPGQKHLDHDEWITHEVVAFRDALRMIQKGRIRDAKSIIAITWTRTFGQTV